VLPRAVVPGIAAGVHPTVAAAVHAASAGRAGLGRRNRTTAGVIRAPTATA
jgi:hypothetical protein